jgi:transcriptional regulator GlxA family with amidase domain
MRIAILEYTDVVPTCVTGPAEIWGGLKQMYTVFSGRDLKQDIEIEIVDISRKPDQGHRYELVIIPAMRYEKIDQVIQRERPLIDWLRQQHEGGAELASICVGSFLLAETGLLKGKKATTNWMFADQFRSRYPDINLQDDKIIVDQGTLYSCGGVFCFTSFMVYLIEKFIGHEAAVITSKILMINTHQEPQQSFSVFRFQHNHTDDPILEGQRFIEANYSRPLTLETLAEQQHMSIRNFIRRFEQATGNTPTEYLQRVRIEAAKKMLDNSRYTIEQVASQCGYEDMSFFRKVFRRHVAMTPKEYQLKYGKTYSRQAHS